MVFQCCVDRYIIIFIVSVSDDRSIMKIKKLRIKTLELKLNALLSEIEKIYKKIN